MTSIAGVVLPHVPALRRYAYLLTGSRETGDSLVERALEALPPELLPATARLDLFRIFDRVNGTVTVGRPDPAGGAMMRRLQGLEPLHRRVILLASALGFLEDEVAMILRRTPAEVGVTMAAARSVLLRTAAGRVLVIEDDALLAAEIADLVESLGEDVCGKAATFDEALLIAHSSRPSLVIADVQLGQQLQAGRDAALACVERFKSAVIFVTAHPDRLLQGGLGNLPILTKPFDRSVLQRAITTALIPAG